VWQVAACCRFMVNSSLEGSQRGSSFLVGQDEVGLAIEVGMAPGGLLPAVEQPSPGARPKRLLRSSGRWGPCTIVSATVIGLELLNQ
jgi:hypothetical protein